MQVHIDKGTNGVPITIAPMRPPIVETTTLADAGLIFSTWVAIMSYISYEVFKWVL